MTNKNTLTWRVKELEKNYSSLDGKVDSILTNHLPELQQELVSLKVRITIATAFNVGAIILGVLISKYL